jgi:multiple sugar transport system substrate-binding protein
MKIIRQFGLLVALFSLSWVSAQVEVVWWDFLGGGDGIRMKAMIDEFNAAHPDIRIVGTTLEWGVPYYTRVQTAIPVGEGPDIMTYHTSRLPLAAPTGIFRPFTDDDLASVGLSKNDYFPNLVDAATINDEFLCVPLDIHSHILYYNREILDSLGMIGDDGLPIGFDGRGNFTAALERIRDEAGVLPLSMSSDAGTIWRVFYSLLSQQGTGILGDDGVNAGEEAGEALSLMRYWIENGLAPESTEYPAGIALFTSGQAAMHVNGVWEVPTMVDLAAQGDLFDWGAIAYPVIFDQPATWADSHCFAIPNSSRRPVEGEKLEAVMTVIAWMNQNSLAWAGAGHIPAYLPVVNSEAYQTMEPNATYAILGETATFDPQSPVAGVASPIYDAVGNYFDPAINGLLPVDQALEMFKQEIDALLR